METNVGDTNQQLIQELRVVFDSCETDPEGRISLCELANLSRSHCSGGETNLVDKLLEIFQCGEEEEEDRVDFTQFCEKMIGYINLNTNPGPEEERDEFADSYSEVNVKTLERTEACVPTSPFSPGISDQGAFNENLKRSFEKTRSAAMMTSSPSRGEAGRVKRKVSGARLAGNIPLVNTSSEDEAEDSFDRQIADSLSVARPMELLVRGSSLRSTLVKKQAKSNPSSPSVTNTASPGRMMSMYPEEETDSEDSSEDISEPAARLTARHQDCSLSSGVDSLKADLEEELQSSLLLARKHGEERLETERRRHSEQVDSMERELDLERRNFQLRYEQLAGEKGDLKAEVSRLREKVELLSLEKNLLEQQMADSASRKVREEEEEVRAEQQRRDREEELRRTVTVLSSRVGDQDQELAEIKEDNIVLRRQVKDLSQNKENKESPRFRIFGGNLKENSVPDKIEDPQDIRLRLRQTEKQLQDQIEANRKLNIYIGDVLANVMASNPQILEKS